MVLFVVQYELDVIKNNKEWQLVKMPQVLDIKELINELVIKRDANNHCPNVVLESNGDFDAIDEGLKRR